MNNSENNLKVITLSGVEGIGRNSYVVQYKEDIYIIDYGMTFPEGTGFGVDYILPDYHWLEKNKAKIKGLIVTHAHLDHVGGIPFVLEKLGFPKIYASPFAVEFIKEKMKEIPNGDRAKYQAVSEEDIVSFGNNVSVSFFHVTHSIPQCYGVCLHTPEGRIVYTGDYKIDETPLNEKPTNLEKIKRLGQEGVLAAMLDSTNAFESGRSKSETEILEVLEQTIKDAEGRVIIATFSSLVTRIAGLLEVAKRLNKKILFTGRSLENNIKIAFRIGYVQPVANLIVDKRKIDKIPDNQLIIVTTGSQGEPMAALTRMAFNKHSFISIKKTDTIIISSSVIPTNVADVQRLADELSRKGARIINNKLMDVHVSGHAYQEDMKKMAQLLNAKYYIPVHGYTSFLAQHKLLLKSIGINESRVLLASEGSVFAFNNGNVIQEKKLKLTPAVVIGDRILDKEEPLVSERKILTTAGFCTIFLVTKNSELLGSSVMVRAFSTKKENEKIVEYLKVAVPKWYKTFNDKAKLKKYLYAKLGTYFMKNYEESPLLAIEVAEL